MPKKKDEKLPDPKERKKCPVEGCYLENALFLEDFCWRHLPEDKKAVYKEKIEKWVKEGYSLEGANLVEAQLPKADLHEANLSKASLKKANLEEAWLWGANLEKAILIFANLKKTNFLKAKLKNADLRYTNAQGASFVEADLRDVAMWQTNLTSSDMRGCDIRKGNIHLSILESALLEEANMEEVNLHGSSLNYSVMIKANLKSANLSASSLEKASLSNANLQGANCKNTNFSQAYLSDAQFKGAVLIGAIWDNAHHLEWCDFFDENNKVIGDAKPEYVKEKGWWGARSAYRALKNHFHQQGKYDGERKAYYNEKKMEKHEAFWECFYGHQPHKEPEQGLWEQFFPHLWKKIKDFFSWFGLWIFHAFTGFGERWWWTVLWALGVIAFFGFLYWGGGAAGWFKFAFKPEMIPSIFQYFYLSVVTFATLGFGDITPLCWQAQIPVVIEVIMGYVFLGLIITIIARRFGR